MLSILVPDALSNNPLPVLLVVVASLLPVLDDLQYTTVFVADADDDCGVSSTRMRLCNADVVLVAAVATAAADAGEWLLILDDDEEEEDEEDNREDDVDALS